jgi:hypothetical protein
MPISLNDFGERLIARMVNELRGDFIDLCELRNFEDQAFLAGAKPIAFTEQKLEPYGGKIFDGASRVDLVVRTSAQDGTPFEVKLGTTRLTKSRIDNEWLSGCGFSHHGERLCGNMMSILERKFPDELSSADLQVKPPDTLPLRLTRTWFLIARDTVLKKWQGTGRPAFSNRVRFLSFESIVDRFGGKEKFNGLVRNMLEFDYYDQWMKGSRNSEN